jgi:hypothetical protein
MISESSTQIWGDRNMYATALSLLVLVLLPACVTDVETGRPEVQQSTPGAAAGIEDDAVESLVKSKVGDLDSCFQEENGRIRRLKAECSSPSPFFLMVGHERLRYWRAPSQVL